MNSLILLFIVIFQYIDFLNGLSLSASSSFCGTRLSQHAYAKVTDNNMILSMGLQIKIRIVGRKNGSEQWLEDAYTMYETRLPIQVETIWHKNNEDLVKGVNTDREKGHSVVLLDPTGKTVTSERFCDNMYDWLDLGGSRMAFVIGGAEGLPTELKYPATGPAMELLSLSSLTFTHQFARTLLMEQIYRATEIRKGSGYHK
jgi:23S rRNA (pseudouridine1915-N3)-methyltransferase